MTIFNRGAFVTLVAGLFLAASFGHSHACPASAAGLGRMTGIPGDGIKGFGGVIRIPSPPLASRQGA